MRFSKKLLWLLLPLVLLIAIVLLCQEFLFRPPGTLKHPMWIPRADQSDVGQTVSLSFQNMWEQNQFDRQYDASDESSDTWFVYVYDPDKETNLLAVFQAVKANAGIAQVTFYQPEWAGIPQMREFLNKPFSAKVLRRTNIDFMEYVYIGNACGLYSEETQKALGSDLLHIPAFDGSYSGTQYYLGTITDRTNPEDFWISCGEGLQLAIQGNTLDNCSQKFSSNVNVFLRIIERFNLKKKLGL